MSRSCCITHVSIGTLKQSGGRRARGNSRKKTKEEDEEEEDTPCESTTERRSTGHRHVLSRTNRWCEDSTRRITQKVTESAARASDCDRSDQSEGPRGQSQSAGWTPRQGCQVLARLGIVCAAVLRRADLLVRTKERLGSRSELVGRYTYVSSSSLVSPIAPTRQAGAKTLPRTPRPSAWPSRACPGLCVDVKGASAPKRLAQEARVFSPGTLNLCVHRNPRPDPYRISGPVSPRSGALNYNFVSCPCVDAAFALSASTSASTELFFSACLRQSASGFRPLPRNRIALSSWLPFFAAAPPHQAYHRTPTTTNVGPDPRPGFGSVARP